MSDKIRISGTGCCLVDILYNNIDFRGDEIRPFLSVKTGDCGLTPGKLVFQEEFEKFSNMSIDKFISVVTHGRKFDKINIGGPSIVSLIHTAQLTSRKACEIRFYGRGGLDNFGDFLISAIRKTPVILKNYSLIENRTPSTLVLSDPDYDNGHGERMFINSIGAARDLRPEDLDADFFNSDVVVFGGTALVPRIHDNLSALLKKAKANGCITVVNTVFDFRNEKANPSGRWPLGEDDESYRLTDLLITDNEEALRLSGMDNINDAVKFFLEMKVPAFVITNGSADLTIFSNGSLFTVSPVRNLPVSSEIKSRLKGSTGGDTTGCGDNFTGGVIASLVNQLISGIDNPDLQEACSWGVVSGGFTCFYMGGTFMERKSGEKLSLIKPFYDLYRKQLAGLKFD